MKDFSKKDYLNAFRYLKILEPTTADYELAFAMFKTLCDCASVKHVIKVSDIVKTNGGYLIADLGLNIVSSSFDTSFRTAKKIAVTASTLGGNVDKKIIYYSAVDVLKATLLDSLASVLIENELDDKRLELQKEYPQYDFSMPFSCGYGDLPLSLQPQIISALNATKLVGISVNDCNLMTPLKSITAFIGLSAHWCA